MSLNMESAFNMIISLKGRDVEFSRIGGAAFSETIKMAPSNYFTNNAAIEEMVVEGREYVVAKRDLDQKSLPRPRRGDFIKDPENGKNSIDKITELTGLGGVVFGYRLRTE